MNNITGETLECATSSCIPDNTPSIQSYENINKNNELKLSFISMVSHEFRSPLTIIQSSAEILETFCDKLSSEEKNMHFQKVYESISNLSGMLDDVILFCRTDAESIKPRFEDVEVVFHSKKILNELKRTNPQSPEINFVHEVETLFVTTDKKLYNQIFSNLVLNSIKYSPTNTKIDVNISRRNGMFSLTIKDQGIGIPQNEKDKIFSPFFRASNTKKVGGSGLGLAIVNQSVNILKGSVTFTTDESKGTVFTVNLPVNGQQE